MSNLLSFSALSQQFVDDEPEEEKQIPGGQQMEAAYGRVEEEMTGIRNRLDYCLDRLNTGLSKKQNTAIAYEIE